MLAPSLQHVDIAAPFDAKRTGLGYTEFGAGCVSGGGDNWVLSAQATLRVPGTFDKANPAAIGYTDPELDIRGAVRLQLRGRAWPAFVDVQVAQRFRFGGPPNELRADLTLGVRPLDRWLVLAQFFNVISEGAGSCRSIRATTIPSSSSAWSTT